MSPESPEFREWAAKKFAEIESLEAKRRAVEESPPDDLRQITDALVYEVMPLMESLGIPITREELTNMFVEWYVKRPPPSAASARPIGTGDGERKPADYGRWAGAVLKPLMSVARVKDVGGLVGKSVKGVLVLLMLTPLILMPAYYFATTTFPLGPATSQSTQSIPGAGGGPSVIGLALVPNNPLIGVGQTQNYSTLALGPSSSTVNLVAFPPAGLNFDIAQTQIPPQDFVTTIQVALQASPSLALGLHEVTVEVNSGGTATNHTFVVQVVQALVVMQHLAFIPSAINVTKGTTVYWMNLDQMIGCCDPGIHDVSFAYPLNVTSPFLARLDTWHYTFQTDGDFFYTCTIHPFMDGEVKVEG